MKIINLFAFCFYSMFGFSQNSDASKIPTHAADSLFSASNWKDAITKYQESLIIDSSNGRVWYRLGAAYQNSNQYGKAIEAYQQSLLQKNNVIPAIFIKSDLAKAYSLYKDSSKALELLSSMVSSGYANFPDLISSSEYDFLRQTARFKSIVVMAKANAYPCLNNPHNREFDFWVGEWNVFQTGTDFLVGKSRIENTLGGCLILENWTAMGNPAEGKSMNFLNPKTAKWEQHYMSISGVSQNYYNGEYKETAMRYDGDGVDKVGNKLLFHLTYFNEGPNQVRQVLERSADSGKTWTTLYDFTYKRTK